MTLVISNPCDNLNHYCYIFFFITYVKNNITFYSKALWASTVSTQLMSTSSPAATRSFRCNHQKRMQNQLMTFHKMELVNLLWQKLKNGQNLKT